MRLSGPDVDFWMKGTLTRIPPETGQELLYETEHTGQVRVYDTLGSKEMPVVFPRAFWEEGNVFFRQVGDDEWER